MNPANGAERQFHECVERDSDSLAAHGGTDCSRNEVRRDGARLVTESVCMADGRTRVVRGRFVGSLDTSFSGEITTAPEGRAEETARYHARWIGPCKSGQKPGDRVTIEAPLIRRALEYGAQPNKP